MGWVLDKHSVQSVYTGDDEFGHARFATQRTEVGEAVYQLKYRKDWSQVGPLARAVAENICPKLSEIGFLVPMPASRFRGRQPVHEVVRSLGVLIGKPVFEDLLLRDPGGASLKDLATKSEKVEAIDGRLRVNDTITSSGRWNVLLVDDLFDSGATMETACTALRQYPKVARIYVAALTWS